MTDTTTPGADAVNAIADLAPTTAENILEIGSGRTHKLAALLPSGYLLDVQDVAPDEDLQIRPDQPRGTLTAADLPSFVTLVDKHATPDAEVYADAERSTVTAIFDGGGRIIRPLREITTTADEGPVTELAVDHDTPSRPTTTWADWRATVAVPVDPIWRDWIGIDGKLLGQQAFAEFLEQHTSSVVDPSAGELYDIATTLEVQQSARYGNATRTSSGERVLVIDEAHEVKAGQSRELRFPERITLSLRPWIDASPREVTALLRYRLNSGTLTIGVTLVGVEEFRREVWTDMIDDLRESITDIDPGILVVNGTPPHARR